MVNNNESLQEIFDTVYNGLWTQNKQSKVGHQCRYRTPTGEKCAGGHLIDDCDYNPDFEGLSVPYVRLYHDNTVVEYFDKKFNHNEQCIKLISVLQSVHDNYLGYERDFRYYLNMQFAEVASMFGLNFISKGE